MTDATSPEDPLETFLSGKRAAPRLATRSRVALVAAHERIPASALDVSEGGALVRVEDAQAFDVAAAIAFVGDRLAPQFRLCFEAEGVEVPAEAIRALPEPDDAAGALRVGCRFARALTPEERARLGLRASAVNAMAHDENPLPLEPRPGAESRALVFDPRSAAGPALLLRVTGLGPRTLDGVVEDAGRRTPDEVRAALADRLVGLRVVPVRGTAWQATARAAWAEDDGTALGRVRVRLALEVEPPAHARRAFRKRR